MPHLRFRAMEPQSVQSLSKSLIDALQPHMDCPREDFTFSTSTRPFIMKSK